MKDDGVKIKKGERVQTSEQTIAVIKEFLDYFERRVEPPKSRFVKPFVLAICQLALEKPERIDSGFDCREIVDRIDTIREKGWTAASNKEAKRINEVYHKLDDYFNSIRDGVNQFLYEKGFSTAPKIEKKRGSGSGNVTLYSIRMYPFHIEFPPKVKTFRENAPSSWVRYQMTEIEKRWFNVLSKGWRIQVLIAVILGFVVLMFYILFATSAALTGEWQNYFDFFATGMILFFAITYPVMHWIRAKFRRISPAPALLSDYDQLIEVFDTDGTSCVRLVKYSGECPVCGGVVKAVPGGVFFSWHIIGRCSNSPVEHVYSFDHVTMLGKPLRTCV